MSDKFANGLCLCQNNTRGPRGDVRAEAGVVAAAVSREPHQPARAEAGPGLALAAASLAPLGDQVALDVADGETDQEVGQDHGHQDDEHEEEKVSRVRELDGLAGLGVVEHVLELELAGHHDNRLEQCQRHVAERRVVGEQHGKAEPEGEQQAAVGEQELGEVDGDRREHLHVETERREAAHDHHELQPGEEDADRRDVVLPGRYLQADPENRRRTQSQERDSLTMAQCSGVRPSSSWLLGSARLASRSWMVAADWACAARCSGVCRLQLSAEVSAPASSSSRAHSVLPSSAASGALVPGAPPDSPTFTSTWRASSRRTQSTAPAEAAQCSGVARRAESHTCALAPAASSADTHTDEPAQQLMCSAVLPAQRGDHTHSVRETNFALQLKGWRENIENFCGSKPPEGGCGSRQAQGFYPLWQPTASVFHGNRRFADCDPIAQFDRFDPRTTIGLPLEVRAVSRALDFLIPVSEALPQRGTRDSNPQPRVPTRSQNRKRPNAQSHQANGEGRDSPAVLVAGGHVGAALEAVLHEVRQPQARPDQQPRVHVQLLHHNAVAFYTSFE
ncbi:Lipoprotein signal peptidase, partial [Frankliniella fusca]